MRITDFIRADQRDLACIEEELTARNNQGTGQIEAGIRLLSSDQPMAPLISRAKLTRTFCHYGRWKDDIDIELVVQDPDEETLARIMMLYPTSEPLHHAKPGRKEYFHAEQALIAFDRQEEPETISIILRGMHPYALHPLTDNLEELDSIDQKLSWITAGQPDITVRPFFDRDFIDRLVSIYSTCAGAKHAAATASRIQKMQEKQPPFLREPK